MTTAIATMQSSTIVPAPMNTLNVVSSSTTDARKRRRIILQRKNLPPSPPPMVDDSISVKRWSLAATPPPPSQPTVSSRTIMPQEQMDRIKPLNSTSGATIVSPTSVCSSGIVGQGTTFSNGESNESANPSSTTLQGKSTTAPILKTKTTINTSTSDKSNASKRKRMHLRYDPEVPMSKEETAAWRKEQRRKRNRESAASSRQKQRDRITELETEVDDWKNKFEEALARLKRLEEEDAAVVASATDSHQKDVVNVMDGCDENAIKHQDNFVEISAEKHLEQEVIVQNIVKEEEESVCPFTPPPSPPPEISSCLQTTQGPVQDGILLSTENTSSEDRIPVSPSPASSPQIHCMNDSMSDDFISIGDVPPITLSHDYFSTQDDEYLYPCESHSQSYPSLVPEPRPSTTTSLSKKSHPILKPQDVWQAFPQLNDVAAEDTHLKEIPRPAV